MFVAAAVVLPKLLNGPAKRRGPKPRVSYSCSKDTKCYKRDCLLVVIDVFEVVLGRSLFL